MTRKSMLIGLEAGQKQSSALAACQAICAHKTDLRCSSHMPELATGTANLIIGMQVMAALASQPSKQTKIALAHTASA